MFKRLRLSDWRQYKEIDILFHKHLTVLTGANGAGKTTLLNILAKNLGWSSKFVSSYEKEILEKDGSEYLTYKNSVRLKMLERELLTPSSMVTIGTMEYSDGCNTDIQIPKDVPAVYEVFINNKNRIKGVYINSHRPTFPYKALNSITSIAYTREKIFSRYYEFAKHYVFDEYRDREKQTSTGIIKEILTSLAIFGYGNKAVSSNEQMRKLFEGYQDILRKVLPPKLGFEKIKVVNPEVMLCTKTGDFPIDAVSGGISSIIDITWQIFMYGDINDEFVVVIDEPENHLHPELQKSFLNNLIKAFPKVQFIVATHNPFMIGAVKDSNVYALNYGADGKVYSLELDQVNRAGTSNAILREVLGIESSMPLWAEEDLKAIVQKYLNLNITHDNLELLRNEMKEIGLADFIPETISLVIEESNDD